MMAKHSNEKGCTFDEAIESFLKEERPTLELHRRGKAEEVAATMAYLCSARASFVNGANFRVDWLGSDRLNPLSRFPGFLWSNIFLTGMN